MSGGIAGADQGNQQRFRRVTLHDSQARVSTWSANGRVVYMSWLRLRFPQVLVGLVGWTWFRLGDTSNYAISREYHLVMQVLILPCCYCESGVRQRSSILRPYQPTAQPDKLGVAVNKDENAISMLMELYMHDLMLYAGHTRPLRFHFSRFVLDVDTYDVSPWVPFCEPKTIVHCPMDIAVRLCGFIRRPRPSMRPALRDSAPYRCLRNFRKQHQ